MPSDWDVNLAGNPGAPGGPPGGPGPTGPGYLATSTTNLPIATGSITVTTQAGLAYQPGARTRLSSNSAPSQWMEGLVTAYSGTSLTVNVDLTSATAATVTPPGVLPNYLGGCILANDATTPNTVLDIGYGAATSDDNSTLMTVPTASFIKNCNAAWVVGSGNGALDSGSALAASTWYHVFLIERVDTFVVDVLISTSATAPVLPTNYTKKRRIGTIATDATPKIVAFTQFGDEFLWVAPVLNINNGSMAAVTPASAILSVPPGIKVLANFTGYLAPSVNVGVVFWSLDHQPLASGNAYLHLWALAGQADGGEFRIRTNTNQQISYMANAASSGLYIQTLGWTDNRGR